MVDAGLANTLVPVVEDKPVDGLQLYEFAPVAVNVVVPPVHIKALAAEAVTIGFCSTVTVTVVVLTHPLASVPVTE